MSKGSNRRPGAGYEDGWSRIFGKKECQHNRMTYGDPGTCLDCGYVEDNIQERYRKREVEKNREMRNVLGEILASPLITTKQRIDTVKRMMEGKPYGVLYVNEVGPKTCKNCNNLFENFQGRRHSVMVVNAWNGSLSFSPPDDFSCSLWIQK